MAELSNPVISWRKGDNSAQMTEWALGTVDAGSASTTQSLTTVLIWNNYNMGTDVKTAYDCKLGVTDTTGNINNPSLPTPDIVKLAWVECRDLSNAETLWDKVGANATMDDFKKHSISANGSTINIDGTFNASPSGDPVYPYPILGVKNDGSVLNSKANYSKVELRTNIPGTASSGTFQFLLKLWFTHI